MKREKHISHAWKIYTDGAIRPERGISGLAALVRNDQNRICYWWNRRTGKLTNNEAEYAAVIFALEMMLKVVRPASCHEIAIFTDSQILVHQMTGKAVTNSPGLQRAKNRLIPLVKKFQNVTFTHIPREQNKLADALAFEAIEGPPRASRPSLAAPRLDLWEQFDSIWRNT